MVFLNFTCIGVGFRVIGQMIVPPVGLFDNKVEIPLGADSTYYVISITNRFVGNYAIQMKVPMAVDEHEASPFIPPEILAVKYLWHEGSYEQAPCRRSWSSLGKGPRLFAYKSVLVPIEVPKNQIIKIQVQFPETAKEFFSAHPGCSLLFGKDSDE